jgi:phosphate transport system permease protein
MSFIHLSGIFLILTLSGAFMGWRRASNPVYLQGERPRSRSVYHSSYTALWIGVPMLLVAFLWLMVDPWVIRPNVLKTLQEVTGVTEGNSAFQYLEIRNIADGLLPESFASAAVMSAVEHYRALQQNAQIVFLALFLLAGLLGFYRGYTRIAADFPAREAVEKFVRYFLLASSTIAILVTLSIVLTLVIEALRFFQHVPVLDFLFGTKWSPQVAIRADQVGSSGAFGVVPLFAGTMLIAFIAMLVAVPIGLLSAIYLSEYANDKVRHVAKPLLEILAGIPTVVYGFFAALTVAPMIVKAGAVLGLSASSESALAAGVVMGVMIIPFISSLSDDVINAVPVSLRYGSLALGATQSETIRKVLLPAALPGIMGAILLAVSRAIGETMIVVMAAGLAANLTANPLDSVTTVTAQIVTILVGDQEFDSAKTLSAFALGLTLFCVTLALNFLALHIVRRYREQYD